MARLPIPGSDKGTWGDILNDYLSQSHTDTGLLKADSVGSDQLQDGAVTSAAVADGELPLTKIDGLTDTLADKQDASSLDSDVATLVNTSSSASSTALSASVKDSTGRRLDSIEISSSFGERARRAAARAQVKNAVTLDPMTSPPTITSGTSVLDATLTNAYRIDNGHVAAFEFFGGTPQLYTTAYYRFPVVYISDGGNVDATHDAKEWAVEAMTDALKVQINMLGQSAGQTIQFEVDGVKVGATSLAYPGSAGASYFLLDFGSVRKPRKIRVEGQLSGAFRGFSVKPTEKVWRPAYVDAIRCCVVGDSVVAATGADSPGDGWVWVMGKLLGISHMYQIGVGGSGFVTVNHGTNIGNAQRVSDTMAQNPDIIFLCTSVNDNAELPATIQAAALAAMQAYRTAAPLVPIVVTGEWPGAAGPSAGAFANETAVKAAFDAWADPNSYWIPCVNDATGSWVTGTGRVGLTNGSGNSDYYVNNADSVHPSGDGHRYQGRRMANAVHSIVLPTLI